MKEERRVTFVIQVNKKRSQQIKINSANLNKEDKEFLNVNLRRGGVDIRCNEGDDVGLTGCGGLNESRDGGANQVCGRE